MSPGSYDLSMSLKRFLCALVSEERAAHRASSRAEEHPGARQGGDDKTQTTYLLLCRHLVSHLHHSPLPP